MSGILDAAKALASEHFAIEALAEQPDAQWLRDLGIQFRLDYGSRPLHTSGLDICHDYVGLQNAVHLRVRAVARRRYRAVSAQRAAV